MAGSFVLIEKISKKRAAKEKDQSKDAAQKKTIFDRFLNRLFYYMLIAGCISFRNDREKQDTDRACNGTWKQNQRQGHTGQNTVDTESRLMSISVSQELRRDENSFYTHQKIDDHTVGR